MQKNEQKSITIKIFDSNLVNLAILLIFTKYFF